MKRLLFLTFFFLTLLVTIAQTQQGIVKTPTRRNVNGEMTQGRSIQNATVEIMFANNNSKQSHVSDGKGEFSFTVSSPYYVTSVIAQKGTYTFIDADFSKTQRRYSTNAVEVLVDDPDVLAKVREEAIAHERSKIRKQIRAKEDEIEELKETNKITTAEYNKMLGELSEYRQSSEAIVHQIAEVYVTTDFDQMDDFNRQLLVFVEDGNFASADSLLKTKGSKEDEFARIKEADAAIKKTKEELQLAEEYNDKDKESFSKRLYSEHLMYLQRPMMQDSALYCMKMRADLDTANVGAVWEYAVLCYKQKKFADSEKYYHICLRAYISCNDIPKIVSIQNNLGILYRDLHDYVNSEKYLKFALENRVQLFRQTPDAYRADLASTQNNIGLLYYDIHDYANSEIYFMLAFENKDQLFRQISDAFRAADLAMILNNLGTLYSALLDYSNSEKYYTLALELLEQLYRENPDAYHADLASTQNNLGVLYDYIHDYVNSEKYFKLALENYEQLFRLNPDAYRADLASTQSNLGNLYGALHDDAYSEKYYKLALEHFEQLFQQNPDAYRSDLAGTQNNLGNFYRDIHDYVSSEKYYKFALENKEQLFRQNSHAYRADLADTQFNLGALYSILHDYANSEKYFKLALENSEQLFRQNPDVYRADLAKIQNNLGNLYSILHDYANSEMYYKLSLEHFEQLFLQNPEAYRSYLATTHSDLGNLYYVLQDYVNSEKYYLLALGHREELYKLYPDANRSSLAATYYDLMLLYAEINNIEQHDTFLLNAISIFEILNKTDSVKYKDIIVSLYNRKIWRMLVKGNTEESLNLAKITLAMDETNDESKAYLAVCYNHKAYEYAKVSDFINAEETIDKAIELVPANPNYYDSKGEIFLLQGKKDEAMQMWKKVLELNPDFLKEHPDGTNLSNGLKKLGLIE